MRKEEYEKAFTEKIESFKNEPEYEILLQLSEKLLKRQKDQKQALETRSLMDRIIVMPKTYIKGWLRGENSLSYREEDKRMLQAFLAGYEDLQREHMDMEIYRISFAMLKPYLYSGYTILKEEEDAVYVGRKI